MLLRRKRATEEEQREGGMRGNIGKKTTKPKTGKCGDLGKEEGWRKIEK